MDPHGIYIDSSENFYVADSTQFPLEGKIKDIIGKHEYQ